MLFRKHIVSTRTLLQLTVAMMFFVGGVGAALAANSGIAPLLVPYTVYTIAGSPQYPTGTTSVQAGFGGEGGPATTLTAPGMGLGVPLTIHQLGTAAYLSGPFGQAVDTAGNVYITDTGNDIIREVNAQTGNITTIAGVIPKGCSGSTCTLRTSGCADGVPAAGNPIGANLAGIAVDAYGNVYFVDTTTATVSVIYRGGTQVANFIALVNPAAVANSGGNVLPGYLYHVGGTITISGSLSSPSACSGTLGNYDGPTPAPGMTTAGAPAFENAAVAGSTEGAQLHGPTFLTLDGAGNIYIGDVSNSTIRVINTQATNQTFFQYTVPPGYMKSISNCNALLTTPCPVQTTTSTSNTGINGPVNAIVFNSQYRTGQVDGWGNLYQLNGTGSGTGPPGIYAAAGYAGGTPLTNLLTAEAPLLATSYGPKATPPNAPSELPLTYGSSYVVMDDPAITSALPGSFPDVLAVTNEDLDIRPSSLAPDPFGTFWYNDNHYPEVERIDQYTGLATGIIGSQHQRATASVNNIGATYTSPASLSNPWGCVYGSSGNPWTQGPTTFDPEGDGCPAVLGLYSGGVHNTSSDGLGNIYVGDGGEHLVRELSIGNLFPATTVGTSSPVTQAIQVHFNASNPPQIGPQIPDASMVGNTTTAFSIPNGSDFSINTTTPEFPMGAVINSSTTAYGNNATTSNFAMWTGLPTCTQLGAAPIATPVQDYDCLVYVTFNPQAPGARQGQLQVTTANGSVYNFPLYGVGVGGQLAVDGGAASQVSATGLGSATAVAVDSAGTVYIADPANNRVVVEKGGNQTTIGTGLKGPMGVAVDVAGNVYISDTGNNRVLKVDPITGNQSVLGNYIWIPGSTCDGSTPASNCPSGGLANQTGAAVSPTVAPPQYAFNAPEGLAVDVWGNVYVADTGNSAVVEITSNTQLGGAVPLLNYYGAPQFKNPVAVAVDSIGNIYVADTKNPSSQIIELPPGGGDLVNVPGTQFPNQLGSGIKAPNGVAVDAAGNLYVSDSTANAVIEVPAGTGPGSTSFALNFPGIKTPAGLALDSNGNLYVADSGNKQVLFDNRIDPTINFGNVPQSLAGAVEPVCSNSTLSDGFNIGYTGGGCVITVTNIGSQPVTLASNILSINGGNPAFSVTNTNCASPLAPGITCTLQATFTPSASTNVGETVDVNASSSGTTAPPCPASGLCSPALSLTANGAQPLVNIVLTPSYSSGTTPTNGATATITATVTQPHLSGVTPTGTVKFTYVVDAFNNNANNCGSGGTVTQPLMGSGGTATASFNLPTLATGVQYTITADYSGDTLNSETQAAALPVNVPGTPVTATVTSTPAQLTFTYGSPAPVPVGTVTGVGSGVTATFGSLANSCTATASYPVAVSFSGTGACAYGNPPADFSSGGAAVVQENKAPLTYTIPNFSSAYGAPNISYGVNATITGAQCGDGFGASFTPPQSSILNVAGSPYTVTPTVIGANIGNYTVTAKPSTLTISKASTAISASLAPTAVLDTAAGVASVALNLSVSSTVPGGKGTPSGSIVITDAFTPITATGVGAPTSATITVPLTAGVATYTPTDPTPGLHQYSFAYSGDSNFQTSTLAPSATAAACTPAALAANCLLVDYPDFTLTSKTGPLGINPGTVPSGNGLLPAPNQSTSFPQTAVLFVNGLLGFSGQVTMSCTPQSPSYVSCFMTPPAVSVSSSSKTAATVVAIQTPATLPLGFKTSELRTTATRTVLAFLPFGVLAFCMRRRRRLSQALWTLMVIVGVSMGMSGCGGNQVDFYTPIPTGPQTVTVTASWLGSATQPAGARSFVVPINID